MTKLPHTEADFEAHIVSELCADDEWVTGDPGAYDPHLGLFGEDLADFIAATQPKRWSKLVSLTGGEQQARASVNKRVAALLDKHGSVPILRDGFDDHGVQFSACQLKPAHSIDPETAERYERNVLRVVRQVRFDPNSGDSVDLVLFVNGIPTATAELKNRWTGQTFDDAIKQYRHDRDPSNVLFARRAFVHFAVDAEQAYMTTRLSGKSTRFLPFNQGSAGAGCPGGAGNPTADAGHATAYLWRQVWGRGRWLELIQKFVHVEPPPAGAPKNAKPTIVFPRFHQWDVVLESANHGRLHGPGHNYLIQHSAGSGKTKEIAWLAHELSTLHDATDAKVFDKVVVITDRRVLDRQLQRQIEQFERVSGVVQSITGTSTQLLEAMTSQTAKIVVTTLQKFPYLLRALDEDAALKDRTYAVIVDEAHSSQTGESATDLKEALGSLTPEELDLDEDDGTPAALLARLAAKHKQPNLSFFAFTATPKAKTLALFGRQDADGNYAAFHVYSMQQAIEEGFIVDVLRNYATYEQLFKIESTADDDLEVPAGQASTRIAKFALLHPYAKTQKAEVVVNHYRQVVRPLLGGRGKAMVVCESREEAAQWKLALDAEVAKQGAADVHVLVAFSGEVEIRHQEATNRGARYTEPPMNAGEHGGSPLPEAKLPEVFDRDEFGILVVAEKYQTGFDQPKLCGMYVDKKLTGVNAVQTLSRLNRSHPGKEEVYVLDFRNTAEEIQQAFVPYFGATLAQPTDPNALFDAQTDVRAYGVVTDTDLAGFEDALSRLGSLPEEQRHAVLSTSTNTAYDRALAMEDDRRQEFRDAFGRFVRYFAFLGHVLPYVPPRTATLYEFGRVLLPRLREPGTGFALDLDLTLTHYAVRETGASTIELPVGAEPLPPPGAGTAGATGEIPMNEIGILVALFNERYGEGLTDDDVLRTFTAMRDELQRANPQLQAQAESNDRADFTREREDLVVDAAAAVTDGQTRQGEFLKVILDDDDMRARVTEVLMGAIWDGVRAKAA